MNMDRLWAPWRMEYIEVVDEEEDCFLCQAARCEGEKRKRELLMVWRSENWVVVMNRWPYNNGHLLIAPRNHLSDIDGLEKGRFAGFGSMLKHCKQRLTEVMSPDGFNVGLNLGRVAGAGIEDHLHWHIVPRWNGDTNFMPAVCSTKVIPQSLEELYDLLRGDKQP